MQKRRRRTAGFTLIEVLVALAIASIGLAAMLAAASRGIGNAGIADRTIEATRRAQSRLALVGPVLPIQPGEQGGEDGDGFTWRLRVSSPSRLPPAADKTRLPALYTIEMTISWPSGGGMRSVSIQSQRLAAAGAGS